MTSSDPPAQTLSFDAEVLGQTRLWTIRHRSLEYRGEVILAESMEPELGSPLEPGTDFRIVFFTVPRRIPTHRIQDQRIAMVVPLRALSQEWGTVGTELRSIHEVRARYTASGDPDSAALSGSLGERESYLRDQLARQYSLTYAQGRIYTQAETRVRPTDIFGVEASSEWVNLLAEALMTHAFPALPIDHGLFGDTLTDEKVSAVFRGLLQDDADALETARMFGPGLGLTSKDRPGEFDASDCSVVRIVQQLLESQGGEMQASSVLEILTRDHGLTRSLSVLYLMAFVRQARAELQIQSHSRLPALRGGSFLADRITWDLVPEVRFDESLAQSLDVLRLQPSPTWSTALPYAMLIVEGLSPEGGETATEEQRRLSDALKALGTEIQAIQESLIALESALGQRSDIAESVLADLKNLSDVSDYLEFFETAQRTFQGPSVMEEALGLSRRLLQVSEFAPAIIEAKSYLELMTFSRNEEEMSLERDTTLSRLDLDSLLANPTLWSSIEQSFQQLMARYANAYLSHHSRYHLEALELRHRMDSLRPQVNALARFNEVPELGDPVGTDIGQRFDDLAASIKSCSLADEELSLETEPHCDLCRLRLDENIPKRDAELLLWDTERAMREYNQRLSSYSARRVLEHPTKEQLDRFVTLVQVADPSSLVNVLDDDVIEFLRQFLRNE